MNLNRIFDPQNKFWSFMEKIMNLCVLSLFWLVFSLPVVTAGASTAALFNYTLKLAREEEGYVWKTFFLFFLSNVVQDTGLWIGMAGLGAFLVFDLYCCQFLPFSALKWAARVVLISLMLIALLTSLYLLPMIAFFRTTIKRAVIHSFVMAMGNLYVSVTILVIYAAAAAAVYFIPVLFMVWFTLASYVASHLFNHVFLKYMEDVNNIDNNPA